MLEQIKASAGSGKTYTLTRRFLQVLGSLGNEADALPCHRMNRRIPGAFSEILAMTFTNKAAAEMKARVLAALKEIALRKDDEPDPDTGITPAEASDWLEIILRRYDSLNIRTIDSLLNLLVQISAINLDIPPDFELAFNEREFLEPLYDELLDKAERGDEEVRSLLRDCAAYLLNTSKSAGLTPRGRIRAILLEVLGSLHTAQAEYLPCTEREVITAGRDRALEAILGAAQLLEAELERLELAPSKKFANFMAKIWTYEPGMEFPASTLVGRSSFTECCNAKEKALVDEALEQAYRVFCAVLEDVKSKLGLYQSALELLPFAKLAMLLLPEIKRLQGESSQITGALLPLLAGEVLNAENGVSEACCRLGSRLNHLLIDEFQDTSRAQWQAILPLAEECLARGGSLRYVGDVKQAIYSWRGGDSSLFDEISAPGSTLSAIEPAPKRTALEFNWRSSPEVVRHNNKFFSRLTDPERAYTVIKALLLKDYPDDYARLASSSLMRAFADTEQLLPQKEKRGPKGYVRMQTVSGSGQPELLGDIRQKLKELFVELLTRRSPGDIAVLVRNRGEATLVTEWLAEWGIGVVTEHSFKLSGNPLLRRLLALLRFLDYPPDDLSFMNFISGSELFARSSRLSSEKLLEWEAGIRKREKRPLPLFHYFQRDFPDEWAMWLEPFYNRSGLMSAYDTVSEIYNRYSLLASAPGHAGYLRRFLELVLAAEKSGYSSLSGFLEFWDDKGREEKIPAPENPDAVQLMTIHKSKGLEFKVVLMPFHRFGGRVSPKATLCEVDGLPLLVKEGPDLGAGYYQGKNSSAVETMHLLYVAWTRASEELYLFIGGSDHDQRNAGLSKALGVLLEDYEFSESGLYSSGEPGKSKIKAEQSVPEVNPPAFIQVQTPDDDDWQPMAWLPKLKIFRSPVPELVYDERVRGIIFHNCLENMHIPTGSSADFTDIISRTVESSMRGFHMPMSHAEAARTELETALNWFCSLPEATRWLAAGRAEQSIMDENGANHRVDRLVEEPDGSLLVLEYKSGQPRPEYVEQIGRYLRLLHSGSGKKTRGLLVYLDLRQTEEVAL